MSRADLAPTRAGEHELKDVPGLLDPGSRSGWPTEFIRYTRTAQAAAVCHANSVKLVAAPR